MSGIRVVLVDDHAIVRTGLHAVLGAAPEIEVIGEAAGGTGAVELVARSGDVGAEGYTAPERGGRLAISPETVDTYQQRINDKLGLTHRADYVKLALKLGLLQSPA